MVKIEDMRIYADPSSRPALTIVPARALWAGRLNEAQGVRAAKEAFRAQHTSLASVGQDQSGEVGEQPAADGNDEGQGGA